MLLPWVYGRFHNVGYNMITALIFPVGHSHLHVSHLQAIQDLERTLKFPWTNLFAYTMPEIALTAVASYGHRVSLWEPGPNQSLGLAGEGCSCVLKMGWTQLGPPQTWHLKTVALSVQQLSFPYTFLEKGMATRSSILAWRIPWTEEPGGYSAWDCKESGPTERLTFSLFSH